MEDQKLLADTYVETSLGVLICKVPVTLPEGEVHPKEVARCALRRPIVLSDEGKGYLVFVLLYGEAPTWLWCMLIPHACSSADVVAVYSSRHSGYVVVASKNSHWREGDILTERDALNTLRADRKKRRKSKGPDAKTTA